MFGVNAACGVAKKTAESLWLCIDYRKQIVWITAIVNSTFIIKCGVMMNRCLRLLWEMFVLSICDGNSLYGVDCVTYRIVVYKVIISIDIQEEMYITDKEIHALTNMCNCWSFCVFCKSFLSLSINCIKKRVYRGSGLCNLADEGGFATASLYVYYRSIKCMYAADVLKGLMKVHDMHEYDLTFFSYWCSFARFLFKVVFEVVNLI